MTLAILQKVGEKTLEYNQEQFVSRLKARIRENLVFSEKWFKHSWKEQEINEAVDKAFNDLGAEFTEI